MQNPFADLSERISSVEALLLRIDDRLNVAPEASTNEEEKPLNAEQAADFLGIAPQTVYQNIKRIPHRKRFGKLYFFRGELLAYLEGGKEQ